LVDGKAQRLQCQECGYYFTGVERYHYLPSDKVALIHRSNTDELFEFDLDLLKVEKIYCYEAFTHDAMYADKAIQAKGAMINKIENLNSQLRDKISYFVRRSNTHAKSVEWFDYRLVIFFNAKNLGLHG